MFAIDTKAFAEGCDDLKKVFFQLNDKLEKLNGIQKKALAQPDNTGIPLRLHKASRTLEETTVLLGYLVRAGERIADEYIRTEKRVVEAYEVGIIKKKDYPVGDMDLSNVLNNLSDVKLV